MPHHRWDDEFYVSVRPDGTVLFPSSWTEEARRNWLNDRLQQARARTDNVPVIRVSTADLSGNTDE